MLNFVENYYEVTEQNKELLRRKIIEEDIRDYNGDKVNVDYLVQVGKVLGNVYDDNPKCTGAWISRKSMIDDRLKKLTTHITKPLMEME